MAQIAKKKVLRKPLKRLPRRKTPQEIAFAKAKASAPGVGKSGMTAFAQKHLAGGSAEQAARAKGKKAGFGPGGSGLQVSKAALPPGYSQAGWSRLSAAQRKLALSVSAANKRKSS